MENYLAAFLQRSQDVQVLHKNGRYVAAMHMGGVAVECLLKHLIFVSLPPGVQREWKTDINNPGHTFTNPGHDYDAALRCNNKLRSRVQQAKYVEVWLNTVRRPDGDFIDMRYLGREPDPIKYKLWWNDYNNLIGWLQANGMRR